MVLFHGAIHHFQHITANRLSITHFTTVRLMGQSDLSPKQVVAKKKV